MSLPVVRKGFSFADFALSHLSRLFSSLHAQGTNGDYSQIVISQPQPHPLGFLIFQFLFAELVVDKVVHQTSCMSVPRFVLIS